MKKKHGYDSPKVEKQSDTKSSGTPSMGTLDAENTISKMLFDAVMGGATLKDVRGVSDDLMSGLYAYAYKFYEQGRLDEAETFFRFLCLYDFYNPEYAMGLAAVHQLKKEYQKAVDVYALAFALGNNDYRAMFYVGQCNLSLRKPAKAKQCFDLVIQNCSDDDLKKRAFIYRDGITDTTVSDEIEECKD
ncbi:type III secretion system translocator chaperone SicA [Herbaspirillum sp. RTI4]|uniref:type III secretion system translocator chaperone SicA n=1 Tax=Herbaspirillum sp. RTI4 TaxID=3048640 RepID=UPI002AB52C5B|nr:type III secretion system translocator chaperone SicA [Herbaspirillum sp. RTI4]MDY7578375.1 type III secretion system translocator chaperone SicA [Herbaspirillum sp. RTI4]MEA9983597.1 type III secretion system translocator chaperone SicA [Herbaspirillum sp. RTI4]